MAIAEGLSKCDDPRVDLSALRRRLPLAFPGLIGPRHAHESIGAGFLTSAVVTAARDDPGSDDYRWLLLLDGSGTAWDERNTRYALEPGSLFVRAPHTPHRIERVQDGRWLEFFLRLPIPLHAALLRLGVFSTEERYRRVGLRSELLHRLVEHTELVSRPRAPGHEASTIASLVELIAYVQRARRVETDAIDRIRQRLDRSHGAESLADLAREHEVAPSALRSAFRRRFGCNPKAYQIRCRIMAAQALLLSGASVAETAEQLGYPDAFAFSKQFRQVVGMPPSRFRVS